MPRPDDGGMQTDVLTLLLAGAGIALAVVFAVIAGTLAARLFFHASGLGPERAAEGDDPPR